MRRMTLLAGFSAATLLTGMAFAHAGGNKYGDTTQSATCKLGDVEVGTVALVGPDKLWPPNHQFIDEAVSATAKSATGPVSLTITPGITDAQGGDGGPTHDPDVMFTGQDGSTFTGSDVDGNVEATMQLRAERSGSGDGRTYTIEWDANFNGVPCSSADYGPFVVSVPHDMGGGNDK